MPGLVTPLYAPNTVISTTKNKRNGSRVYVGTGVSPTSLMDYEELTLT